MLMSNRKTLSHDLDERWGGFGLQAGPLLIDFLFRPGYTHISLPSTWPSPPNAAPQLLDGLCRDELGQPSSDAPGNCSYWDGCVGPGFRDGGCGVCCENACLCPYAVLWRLQAVASRTQPAEDYVNRSRIGRHERGATRDGPGSCVLESRQRC